MSTSIVILTKMKHIFLYVATNIWYNSARPYAIHQRGHLIDKKLENGKICQIWSINPLFAVTHKTDFFSIIYFTAIINHAFSRIDDYVNALIERHIAPYCRWI